MFARDLHSICAVFEPETWLALSDGARNYIHLLVCNSAQLVITKSPVRRKLWIWHAATWASFLVVPTFVARRLQVLQDARAHSGESWNYLSRRLSCNVEDLTLSTPFRDHILATNLWEWGDGNNYFMCVKSMSYNKPHEQSNDVRPSDYMCCISFRNINCANWQIRV